MNTLQRLEPASVDLMVQDPPYAVTRNHWDRPIPLAQLWVQWKRVIKDNGAMIFFSQQPFTTELISSCRELFRYDLIWYKPLSSGFLNAKRMPLRNHEHILVFYKKLPTYHPMMGVGIRKKGRRKTQRAGRNYNKFTTAEQGHFDDKGTRYPQSVVEFTNGDRTKESFHPTQKPLDLLRYLILSYSNAGDMVFDGYFGSGTTPAACVMEGRRFIGSELIDQYFHFAMERVKSISGTGRLF